MKKPHFLIMFFGLCIFPNAWSEAIFIEQLSFGTIVVGDNSVASSITMTYDGFTVPSGSIYVIAEGQPAEMEVSNLPARRELTITAAAPTSVFRVGGGSTNFVFTSIQLPSRVVTDGIGYALFPIGGTLITSGNSQTYMDGLYRQSLQITITYN